MSNPIGKVYFWLLEHFGFPEPLTNYFRRGYAKYPVFWIILFSGTSLLWFGTGAFIIWFIYHIAFKDKNDDS